jgi:hypothetical protein
VAGEGGLSAVSAHRSRLGLHRAGLTASVKPPPTAAGRGTRRRPCRAAIRPRPATERTPLVARPRQPTGGVAQFAQSGLHHQPRATATRAALDLDARSPETLQTRGATPHPSARTVATTREPAMHPDPGFRIAISSSDHPRTRTRQKRAPGQADSPIAACHFRTTIAPAAQRLALQRDHHAETTPTPTHSMLLHLNQQARRPSRSQSGVRLAPPTSPRRKPPSRSERRRLLPPPTSPRTWIPNGAFRAANQPVTSSGHKRPARVGVEHEPCIRREPVTRRNDSVACALLWLSLGDARRRVVLHRRCF